MKNLLKQTLKIWVLMLAIFFQGCDTEDAPLPEVIAGFTYTLNEDTGTVTFINISTNARTYSWNFGDGGTSTEINPINTYATGTYTVTVEASNVAGDSDTFEDEIVISIPAAVALPITFDESNVAYDVATFNGTAFEIIDNPDVSGTNDKASNVGAITNIGTAFEGINFDLGSDVDLTSDNAITMNFWAENAVDVLVKLEEGTGADTEVTASHSGTGWEILSFTFNSTSQYSRLTIFVDGPGDTEGIFYIDDIIQAEAPPTPCVPETEQSLSITDYNLTFQTDPGDTIGSFDAVLTTIDNPDSDNDVNTSCKVGQIERNGGALFANNQIEFDTKIDFNGVGGFKMKVWSPDANTNVLVKLEDKTNSDIFAEVAAITTKTSEWEELTFTFAETDNGKYDKIILFFELNTNTTQTYYIDDFVLFSGDGGGTGGGDCVAETEQSLSPTNFNLTFQTDPGDAIGSFDAQLTTINNPDFDNDVNTSCKVGQIDRSGSAPFANNQIAFDSKLDFSTSAGFKLKVWSPNAGTNVLVKLEDQANAGTFTQLSVATTKASEWEELTFPFSSNESNRYDLIILFFELDTDTTETYFIDDFALYAREGGNNNGGGDGSDEDNLIINGGFETGDTSNWETSLAGNSGTFNVTDSFSKCGTFSGSFFASSAQLMVIRQANLGVGEVTPNSEITISFDLRGEAGNGGVFIATLFSESTTDGVTKTDILNNATPIPLNDVWTRYTFTTTTGPDVSNGVSLLLKAECGAVDGCEVSADIDNIYVALGSEGGPSCDDGTAGDGNTGGGSGGGDNGGGDNNGGDNNGGGDTSNGIELTTNGDFETGDTTGWTLFTTVNNGAFDVTDADANGGTFSGKLTSDVDGGNGGGSFPLIKQANIGIGTVQPNKTIIVTFDLRGSLSGDGGVFFAEFFSELATEGVSKAEILGGGPLFPNNTWTTYTYTVTTGDDVSGGVTLQLKSDCGPIAGCGVEAFLDNVSVKYIE